jgi:hypothetical protein
VLAVFQQGLMMIWLLGTTHPVMFFLFAFFWGIVYGGAMPPYALFVKNYCGRKSFGAIYGGIMVLASLGMAVGGYLGGFPRPCPLGKTSGQRGTPQILIHSHASFYNRKKQALVAGQTQPNSSAKSRGFP